MSENINSPEYIKRQKIKAEENSKLRKAVLNKFIQKEINIDEFIKYSENKPFKQLGRLTALKLITMMPGWTQNNALSAFVSYGIPVEIKIQDIKKSKRYLELYKILLDAETPVSWKKRIKAPEGWPWRGNILLALKDIEENKLPSEVSRAVRYELGKDSLFSEDINENKETPLDELDTLLAEDDYDELDTLLAEDEDDNELDELDALLAEDE